MAKKMKKLLALVLTIAMVLSFMSVGAFAAEPEPSCGVEAHEHDEGCYAQVLKCELTEGEDELICDKTVHEHGEGCSHTHDATCVGNTCGQDACTAEEHEHTDACHKHSDACTGKKCALTACTEEHEHTEECHLHTDDCRGNACALLLCVEEHEHTEDCHLVHTDDCTLNTCELEECDIEEHDHATAGCHQHNEECIGNTCGLDEGLICTTEVHAHGEDCYAPHVHGEDCYESKLTCEKALHTHTDACYLSVMNEGEDYVAQIGEVGYETLAAAVADANKDTTTVGAVVIELLADTTFSSAMTISRDITITGDYTITRADTYTGTLFTVNAGVTLTLEDLTIDGGNNWTFRKDAYMADINLGTPVALKSYVTYEEGAPVATKVMISVSGNVVMNDSTIRNNASTGGIFSVANGATLTMSGATIDHNTKTGGSVVAYVAAGGTWTINAGTTISNNHNGNGNGTLSDMEGTCIMNGGEIYGNTGVDCNGSVMMLYGSKAYFEMNDGYIHDNGALRGKSNGWNAAFYVYGNGTTFIMNDGLIKDNYGTWAPGIVTNGDVATVTINGGDIVGTHSSAGRVGSDVYSIADVTVNANVKITESRYYNDLTNDSTITGDVWFDGNYKGDLGHNVYSGGGTIDGDVTVFNGSEADMMDGEWINGIVWVNAVGTDSTLTVKDGATIDGIQVRVLDSVASGSDLDAEQAKAAQEASYVEETGANVKSPVLYYHRLTSAQKQKIVVTYDYNGGLDAQGWSGCQRTTAGTEFTTTPLPAPTREGYVLAGWNYATDNDPESLSMAGNVAFEGEAITESVRLIAQWEKIKGETFTVTYKYIGTVPSGAPSVPTDSNEYEKGDEVNLAAEPTMDGYTFSGWTVSSDLTNGMPAKNVTITGYWLAVNNEIDPPIGIKTDKKLNSDDYSYEVKIEVPGDGEVIHDEVILIIDGSYSNSAEWGTMKENIIEIGKTVLNEKNKGRTQITVISFGMDDYVVAEGIATVAELEAELPSLPGGLLYGRSSSNCEVGFTGAMEYIQKKSTVLNDVNVIFISDGGINTDETPRDFSNWKYYSTYVDDLYLAQYSLDAALQSNYTPAAVKEIFGEDATAESVSESWSTIAEDKFYEFCDALWAEVYEFAGLTVGEEYPISVVEHAFVSYDKTKDTNIQDTFYYSTYKSQNISYPNVKNRTITAAETLATLNFVDNLYLVRYGNHSSSGWMDDVNGTTYYYATSVGDMITSLSELLNQLSTTNYKNVVVTDYMSKWVNLDVDSIHIVNDTTGETIWNNTNGWLITEGRPTAQATPVVVEKVDAADYAAGGEDVVGNTNGDIYKLTWYVKDDALLRTDTYSLRYTVTVDTEEDGFLTGTDYPANGTTEVTYEDENGDDKKNDIEVPHVDVPGYTVTYINGNTIVQKDILLTGEEIPEYIGAKPEKAFDGEYSYWFTGWRLISGTEGTNGTVGTTNLVYEAVYIEVENKSQTNSELENNDVELPDQNVPLAGIPAAFREDHIAYIIGRNDGLVHPEANITRAEVATIFFRLLNDETREQYMTSVNYFTDVNEGDWYNNAVSTLNAMGIIYGRSAEIFDPNANITRAEFAAIAARFDPTASTEGGFFTDIDGHWAELEINMAANNGWVEGYEGLFRPDDEITRAEAMTMINRVLHRIPETEDDLLDYMIIWPDNMDIKKWYYLAVQEATNSHDYGRKENEYEYWTALQEVPDWAALEY